MVIKLNIPKKCKFIQHIYLFLSNVCYCYRWYSGAVKTTITSQPQGPVLGLLSVQNFACSFLICLGFLWVLQFQITIQKHADRQTGYIKLSLSVEESLNVSVYSALYVHLMPCVSRIGSMPTSNLSRTEL